MSKHTKGPWLREGRFVYALTENTDGSVRSRRAMPEVNRFVAQVSGGGHDGAPLEELEDTAELMRAAPELLEMLRALWSAATAIMEDENPTSDECRYCLAEEYPTDARGERVAWESDSIVQYAIDHEDWCPFLLIDRAFDELDQEMVDRVLGMLKEQSS